MKGYITSVYLILHFIIRTIYCSQTYRTILSEICIKRVLRTFTELQDYVKGRLQRPIVRPPAQL
jgi:hypothetical protein